jgi:quercetin dioxygenase-like cupin family protein
MKKKLLFVCGAVLALSFTFAQDDPFAGTTTETLGSTIPDTAEGQALVFLRITMEPGARIDAHNHPGSVILVVDSGTFGTEFTQGEGQITRSGEENAQTVRSGTEQILEAGDSIAYGGNAAHTMVNAGDEPLVLLVSALLDPDQPGFLFNDEEQGH